MTTAILDEYRERLERRRRKPKTVAGFVNAAQHFVGWCEENGIDPDNPDRRVMEDYFAQLGLARSTRHRHLTQLRAAYRYAMGRGVLHYDPTIDVELPREADRIVRVIPMQTLKTSKAACRTDQDYLLFHMCAYTGARQFEIAKMTWDDIVLAERTIEIIGKGGKRRLVPIHPALGELLVTGGNGYVFPGRGGKLAGPSGMMYRIHRFCPEYGYHDFRRTVASSLDANGVGRSEIDEIMGWSPRTVFERHYRRVAPERLQRAILMLYANDPL